MKVIKKKEREKEAGGGRSDDLSVSEGETGEVCQSQKIRVVVTALSACLCRGGVK